MKDTKRAKQEIISLSSGKKAIEKRAIDSGISSQKPDDILKTYLRDISKYPLLSAEEEKELGKILADNRNNTNSKKYKNARDRMFYCNTKLVVKRANVFYKQLNKSASQIISLMDLIQDGNEGLLVAIDKYEYSKDNRFSTYAIWWIDCKIKESIEKNSASIAIPERARKDLMLLESTRDKLIQENGREPTLDELCKELDGVLEKERIIELSISPHKRVSIDEQTGDEDRNFLDTFVDAEAEDENSSALDYEDKRNLIDSLLAQLLPNEAYVVKQHIGYDCDPKNFKEIGKEMGISSERVRQIFETARLKMRKMLAK